MAVMAAAFAACSKQHTPAEDTPQNNGAVYVNLQPEIVPINSTGAGTPQTRYTMESIYNSSSGSTNYQMRYFRLCTIPEEDYDDYGNNVATWYGNLGYDNIRRDCHYSYWYLRNVSTASSMLGFFPTKGAVRLYGGFPEQTDLHQRLATLDKIPFWTCYNTDPSTPPESTHTDYNYLYNHDAYNYDYMYMEPVRIDMTGVKPGDQLTVPARFKHVMTTVEFRIRTTMTGTVLIDSIALDTYDGDVRANLFAMGGTYSYYDGSVNTDGAKFVNHSQKFFNKTLGTYAHPAVNGTITNLQNRFPFIFPAIEHRPGRKIKATIYVRRYVNGDTTNNGTLDFEGQPNVVWLDFDKIQTPAGSGEYKGLAQGYRYVYTIDIDNFIKYSGYPEVEPWVLATDEGNEELIKEIVI